MKINDKITSLSTLALYLGCATLAQAQWQPPACEYHFDEGGTNAINSGSSDVPLTFYDTNEDVADLHSTNSVGVSGLSEDYDFDNSGATAMGGAGVGGRGVISHQFSDASSFSSFTLQCWFKASTPITSAARLFDAGKYVVYGGSAPGLLWFQVNGSDVPTPPVYGAANEWIFFAVSYDSTLATNNVVFYYGTKTSAVTAVGISTLKAGSVTNNHPVGIGNVDYGNFRPFQGHIDNVRIFVAGSGGSGAITQEHLEFLRRSDVAHFYSIEVTNATLSPDGYTFDFQTVPAFNYTVLRSTNLIDWLTITNFSGNGSLISMRDPENLPRAFYRVTAQ